jgi:PAS domain S-box-containing protein
MEEKNISPDSGNELSEDDLQERYQLPVINQEMLYTIFSTVQAILCVVSGPEFIYEFANQHYKNLIGHKNLIGKKMGEVLPEMKAAGVFDQLEEVYHSNKPLYLKHAKFGFTRPNGDRETFYLDINCQVYYSKDENNKRIFVFAYDVTDQVKSAKLSAAAERKFRNLFYNNPTPLYTCDQNGKIILYNDAFVKFFGREPSMGNDIWSTIKNVYNSDETLIPDTNWKDLNKINGDKLEEIEYILEFKDGVKKNVIFYPELLLDEDGETEGTITTIVDVTEQVNARKELEVVAKVIQNLYIDAPAFICTLRGPEHIYELVNPAYQNLFGKKELRGKRFIDVSPELRDQGLYKLLNHVYKTGKPFVGTEQLFHISRDINQEPESAYLNFSLQPIHNANQEISGLVIFGYDVTELVYTRQKGEENLKKILESLPQITSISSSEGTNIYFNNFFYDYSGISEEEASVNGWNSILHPDEFDEVIREWEEAKIARVDFHKELRLRRFSDGLYRWHIVHLTAVKNKRNEVLQWIASATDIHEQKWKEEKKDEFLSIASHELKTPLTSVKAYLQLIELSLGNAETELKLFTKKAIVSVDRLHSLISELLDVSKIQQQKLNLNITSFDFDTMIKGVIESAEFSSGPHKIIKSGEIINEIEADRERVEQVINNIIGNAIKYSPEGGDIIIKVSRLKDALLVSVSDKGIGISSFNLEKIFERYFRAEGHDIHFQGLGIGLFISMEIIKMHGGRMWATSTLGKGSTFSFLIPM